MGWSSVRSADDWREVHSLEPDRCSSYAPGHELHWIHWKRLRANPSTPVTGVTLRRGFVEVTFGRQWVPVLWWHHDLDRLLASLWVNDQDLEAWPQWHALRVGHTLFNCGESTTACIGR